MVRYNDLATQFKITIFTGLYFYFGKNASSILAFPWNGKNCVAAIGALRFSVRGFGRALFILRRIAMVCPKCNSENVTFQTFQEQAGSTTVTKTKSKYKEKRHGLLWWLCIGWWWWIVDLFMWIFVFPVKLILAATRKKKYKGKSTATSTTRNQISYKTVCTCQSCGHTWKS